MGEAVLAVFRSIGHAGRHRQTLYHNVYRSNERCTGLRWSDGIQLFLRRAGHRFCRGDNALSAKGCEKAASFVNFCDAFEIPVLTLTNVAGFKACKCSEKKLAKAAAKLTYVFANATVPKVNVVIGKAYGTAYSIMNSKALGADLTFAWDSASIGMMDSKLAAKIMCDGKSADEIEASCRERV